MNNENLGELFGALALARQEFGIFTKSKTATIKSDKGSYGYSYADLSDIIEATAAALAKHGLVVIQEPEVVSDGGKQLVVISGCIAHKSGGVYQLRSLAMPVAGSTAQSIGSAVSYARRYQLSAVLNLAAADDDGQDASQDVTKPMQKGKSSAHNAPATQQQATEPPSGGNVQSDSFEDSNAPDDAEAELLDSWKTPADAHAWAVAIGACENIWEAQRSFKNLVDDHFGGKCTKSNLASVHLAYMRKQEAKLEELFNEEQAEQVGA